MSKRGTSRRLIVAAIGGGNEPGAVPNARTFGRLIALAGPILLTGGIPVEDEGRVSDAALSGCQALGGRMISVLPRQNANVCALVDPSRIEVRTKLSSYGRDPITGAAADLIVAFPGELGTLVEVAYASLYGRPVVFCQSRELLHNFRQSHQNELLAKLQIAVTQYGLLRTTATALMAALDRRLGQHGTDVEQPEEALATVRVLAGGVHVDGATHFRGLPGSPEAKQQFEKLVLELSAQ